MTALPSISIFDDPLGTAAWLSGWVTPLLGAIGQMPGGAAANELTIASGSIVPTGWAHSIDTEADAASDDLANIAVTNHPDGREILIFAADGGRTVVVKNSAGGSGQIVLLRGSDYSLDETTKCLRLRRSGTQWVEEFLNPGTAAGWLAYIGAAATSHTHAQSDVTGLVAALAAKAATVHTHVISDTTGLQTALDGKAPLIGAVPVGAMMAYGPTSAPTGWLLCYGQAVSRTTYAALWSAIGTTYGSGNGTTTFNVPDIRGRVVAGQDDMGGVSANRLTGLSGGVDGDVLGAAGGLETHTLTTAQLAVHHHGMASSNAQGAGVVPRGTGPGTDIDTSDTGSGDAHNNVQPTLVLNYIIFAGV